MLTCQDYTNGYYGAYHRVAEEDVDFVVHVGDFIYESVAGDYKGRGSPDLPDRDLSLPSGHDLAWSLDDYRHLYRTYRSIGSSRGRSNAIPSSQRATTTSSPTTSTGTPRLARRAGRTILVDGTPSS